MNIEVHTELSRSMTMHPVSGFKFEVKDYGQVGIIDIRLKICNYKQFDLQQQPCVHALATCKHNQLVHNSFYAHFYTTVVLVDAYAESIH